MPTKTVLAISCGLLVGNILFVASAQAPSPAQAQQQGRLDAVVRAQEPMPVQTKRPEQQKTAHDTSNVFDESHAEPSSPAFRNQPGEGKVSGFDFYRDPLNSDRPYEDPMRLGKSWQRISPQSWRFNASCWRAGITSKPNSIHRQR